MTQPAFDRKLDVLRRQLRDAAQRQPVALASYHRNLAMQSTRYSNEQLSEAAAQVTLSDVAAAQAGLLKAAQLEVLVTGNLREAEAATMVRQVADVLPTAPLPPELVPQRRVRVLPLAGATQQWVAENPDEANSALELYLQVNTHRPGESHATLPLPTESCAIVAPHLPLLRLTSPPAASPATPATLPICTGGASRLCASGPPRSGVPLTPAYPTLPLHRWVPTRTTIGSTCCYSRRCWTRPSILSSGPSSS